MKLLIIAAFLFCVPLFVTGQGAHPNRWRGLTLDESTPDDAIKILGTPAKDKLSALPVNEISDQLIKRRKEKIFRALEFKQPVGLDKAALYFLDDKLVFILLDTKKDIVPASLKNIYGIDFAPIFGRADLAFSPRDFDRDNGKVTARSYPAVYNVLGKAEKSFVLGMVGNSSFGRSSDMRNVLCLLDPFAKATGQPSHRSKNKGVQQSKAMEILAHIQAHRVSESAPFWLTTPV